MKYFFEWMGVKRRLDGHAYAPPLVTEGDIWWCAIGENVGVEIAGKGEQFTRPVIVIKKFGRLGFLAVPTTTRLRSGSWYVQFNHKGLREVAILSQARLISYKRLDKKIGTIDRADFKRIKEAYIRLLSE